MENTLIDVRQLFERGIYKNEQHIRLCVVCRILQELGWDIWNPDEVYLEFACAPKEDASKVDVALKCSPQKPVVFIETKSPGQIRNKLSETERQLRDYNRDNTAKFSIITDGAEWRFYYALTEGEFSQKCFKTLNLLREPIQDAQASFQSLLLKTEVQNGNAETKAKAYLRLTQKQRLMEELLPDAKRKTWEAPFPSWPKALIDLLMEQGEEVSVDEAEKFISGFQGPTETRSLSTQPPNKVGGKRGASPKPPLGSGVHKLDPRNPGDLRFTKIIEGRIGSEEATGWNDLVNAGLRIAQSKGVTFTELKRSLSLNMTTEQRDEDGFSWHSDLKLSIQGVAANKAAENLYRLATIIKQELYVRLLWREKEDAVHPGEEGVIDWRP